MRWETPNGRVFLANLATGEVTDSADGSSVVGYQTFGERVGLSGDR